MKVTIEFATVIIGFVGLVAAGPVVERIISEEYNKDYLLYERSDGVFEIEDFTNATIETYATESDLTFHFYSREQRHGFALKSNEIANLASKTNYNPSKETLVIIHGWRNHHGSPVNTFITDAALDAKDINIFVVDWSPVAGRTYITAQGSVVLVGNFVGKFLLGLIESYHQSYDKITIAGHSLGAHIAGNAGAALGGRIGTLIGLDPAGPRFRAKNTENRLDPTDGIYVKVIHSNDGMLGFGIQMGHSDYYPNGGKSQPGCGLDLAGTCAHSRAYEYYTESLWDNAFLSRNCDSYRNYNRGLCDDRSTSLMGGILTDKRAFGDYFLDTNSRAPYGRGRV